jgi:Ca-activated chloride channel family protein
LVTPDVVAVEAPSASDTHTPKALEEEFSTTQMPLATTEQEEMIAGVVQDFERLRDGVIGGEANLGAAAGTATPSLSGDIEFGYSGTPTDGFSDGFFANSDNTAAAEAPMSELAPMEAPSVVAPSPLMSGLVDAQSRRTLNLLQAQSDGFAQPLPENRDQFAGEAVSPIKVAKDEPVSTFSIDVDTASYSVMRRSLLNGYLPDPNSVRTEELINYFDYNYASPQTAEQPFAPQATLMPTPWNDDTLLLHIGIQGYEIPMDDRPAVNLVFLIDTSGSMNAPDKLPLLIQSFRLLLTSLNEQDTVAIVTYAGSAGMALEPTSASESYKILTALNRLSAGGSTAGQAGLEQAYGLAESMMQEGETSRVILATDGDFNVGLHSTEAMQTYIEDKRETGVYLSILGFGQGNYNDALMQTLAQNGNGTAAYIDTLAEAQKVLVDQIGGALFTIAQDVKIQVEFNPSEVAEYRLIGYETRALNREDVNNDAVDAGDIGAGTQVTALYEITPVGSAAISVDPLRYGDAAALPEGNGELAFLKLRYKLPGQATSNLITTPVLNAPMDQVTQDVIFSTAVASFGQLLRGDTRMGGWSYDDVLRLAQQGRGEDMFGYRSEFIRLVRLAETAQ